MPLLFHVEKSLGPLEEQVMKIIWNENKTTVRDIVNIINKKKPIAYTTVMTVMDNLYKKGFLTRKKIKKPYYYLPTAGEDYLLFSSVISSYVFPLVRIFRAPVGYGISLTFLLAALIFSAYDLFQNLSLSGTADYLKFLISDLTLSADRLYLYILAFFESLPAINMLTTATSFILIILLIKKLSKLFRVRRMAIS